MASSSTLTADSISLSGEYEVFLSFCGKDTRNGFTDFLYTYLQGASVRTFRDDNELRVGEVIGPELLRAIKNSKISIPIFSKNYASSKWCLMELAKIVECHAEAQGEKKIFPIFYDVDPHDVRHQSGSYEEAFRQHEKKKRLEVQTVQNWKEALVTVGQLKGLELKKETGGREGELVKIVVEKVLEKLKKNYTLVPKNLVGIDKYVENLKGLLKVDSGGVRIVGIHGMGGLGKTTIAKVTYNQLCGRFESHCFLDNVREKSKHHDGILDLQSKLISKIQNGVVPKLSDVDEGGRRIKNTVCGRKVLIVLDDVDEISQVDMLMGNHSWFGAQSRIIITTRDKDVLCAIETACQIEDLHDVCTSYKPEYMGNGDSIQLFSKYAFMRDSPMEGYERLSEEVVSIAAGLPLVLVVLGSAFFGVKDKELWEAKLKKLRVIPHEKVQEKLRFSFEALQYEAKQIFLDIACLFIESDVTLPSYMWEGCGFYPREGISVLVSKSLVTVDDDDEFIMHDQLRDLGRQIVREEGLNELGKRSRLWCEEEAMQVLETSQGTSSVAALSLPYEPSEGPVLASSFHDIPNLRYLDMGGQDLDGDFKHSFPNLRCLRWTSSRKFSPTNLQMKNLVILDLSESDWKDLSHLKMGNNLKVLNLSECDVRVLPHLSTFRSLEVLGLRFCSSLCSLDGLEQLKCLKYLDALNCGNLETLPSLSNLTNLIDLNLGSCYKLVEIQGLEKLESLQELKITGCESLERLPNFSNLKKLKTFQANGCSKLIEIEGLEKLESLQDLDISECESLERLPDLSNLKKLKAFQVGGYMKLVEIQGLEKLESLQDLGITEWESLERLSDFSNLKKLKTFQVHGCSKLIEIEGLQKLESLQDLDITKCESLERLPDFSNLKKLKTFQAGGYRKLVKIQGLEKLESLQDLGITEWESLERLSDFSNLKELKTFQVHGCSKLIEIEGLEKLESLQHLDINKCESLQRLSDFSNLKKLKRIRVVGCSKLIEIEGLEKLEYLRELNISDCSSLERIPIFSNLKSLVRLCAQGCGKLIAIEGLDKLNSLRYLDLRNCSSLKGVLDMSNFINLETLLTPMLEFKNFSKLKRLKKLQILLSDNLIEFGLDRLDVLEKLKICGRYKKTLPDLSKSLTIPRCNKLQTLDIDFPEELTEIHGLADLKSLEQLYIRGCTSIEALPDFSNLEKLTILDVSGCVKLTEIRGLEKLKSLEQLDISGCKSIEALPDISNLKKLIDLKVSGCVKLTEICGLEELKSLKYLFVNGCERLRGLPNFPDTRIHQYPTFSYENYRIGLHDLTNYSEGECDDESDD